MTDTLDDTRARMDATITEEIARVQACLKAPDLLPRDRRTMLEYNLDILHRLLEVWRA